VVPNAGSKAVALLLHGSVLVAAVVALPFFALVSMAQVEIILHSLKSAVPALLAVANLNIACVSGLPGYKIVAGHSAHRLVRRQRERGRERERERQRQKEREREREREAKFEKAET
jgi:hypothetical protein